MKKIKKLMAVFTTIALLTEAGLFTSCSTGSSDDSPLVTPVVTEQKKDDKKDEKTDEKAGEKTGENKTENQVTGPFAYVASSITVEELGKMNPVPESGKTTKLKAGSYSIWGGKGLIVTQDDKMSVQINAGKETPVAIVSATNMTGMNATAVPVVGANLKSIMPDADSNGNVISGEQKPVNYVLVNADAGNNAIKLNISVDASSKDLPEGLSYWVLATDESGKILAVKDLGDIKTTAANFKETEIDLGTAVLGDKVCFGFARGVGSGGLKIHSITLTKTAKSAAEKPAVANFVAVACTTSEQNDGKITISNEEASKLEYKTDGDWAALTALELTGLKAGTYSFRYKETDTTLASEAITVEVAKWVDTSKYFESFVASSVAEANVDTAQKFEASDGTWTISNAKYQLTDSKGAAVSFETYDYDAANSKGYKYSGRIKIQKDATLEIKTKKDTILRIEGGSPSNGTERKLAIEGADVTEWAAKTNGSFWLKATDSKVTLKANGEFNIYGIHIASEKVADAVAKTKYEALALSLKKGDAEVTSCTVNDEVKATVTVKKTETYIQGNQVVTENVPVTTGLSWEGATVSDTGVVTTSVAGKLTIKVTYTYGSGENDKLSATKELDVSSGFTAATKTLANDADTLGLVATEATSDKTEIATVTIDGGIKITSVAAGTATVTCKAGEATATIDVTVAASGEITTVVHKYVNVTNSTGVWNLKERTEAPDGANAWDASTALASDVVLAADSGTGTLTVLKGVKAKYNSGLQFSNGSSAKNLFCIEGTGKVAITYNAPSTATESKPFALYAEGDEANKVTATEGKPSGTYEVNISGKTKFFSNDCRLVKVEFKSE